MEKFCFKLAKEAKFFIYDFGSNPNENYNSMRVSVCNKNDNNHAFYAPLNDVPAMCR